MRTRVVVVVLVLALPLGCKKTGSAPPPEPVAQPAENKNPYRNVTPQKVKEKVEDIQKKEDELNDKRMEQMKE